MNETTQTPVRFGPADALMGMLTAPVRQAPAGVACLMFNMGANHRVGPRRINVKLAHMLAARGVSSLRFDLGGVGDSDALDTSPELLTRAVHSLQAAMDVAERMLGVRQFAIVGMCSGVEHSMAAAAADPRVVAVSLFDGFAFPERRARWERNLRRALAAPAHPSFPGKAKRWLQRHFLRSHSTTPLPGFFAEKRTPDDNAAWFSTTLRGLVERKVAVQLLYSGSLHVCDRGRDQLGALGRESYTQGLQYEFMAEVDHTVCTERGQQLFLKSVGDWVTDRCFGASTERRSQSRPHAGTEHAMPTTWAAP
jgi:alpha-beta hydrolase superfamily lysophospholipase